MRTVRRWRSASSRTSSRRSRDPGARRSGSRSRCRGCRTSSRRHRTSSRRAPRRRRRGTAAGRARPCAWGPPSVGSTVRTSPAARNSSVSGGGDPSDRERDRTDHLGAVAEGAGDDLERPRRCRAGRSGRSRRASPSTRDLDPPRIPPTTTSSRVEAVARSATARPTVRPASVSTRRTPASPVLVERQHRARWSAARRTPVAAGSSSLAARDHRLEAAAVAAAADLAVLADLDVTDLAGDAAGAAVQPAAEHDPGADAAGDLQVDTSCRPRALPWCSSASAPRLASLSA